jgi:hypothetical protein
MSPECARGEMYNCLSDMYSFGLLVHELITLDKPYKIPSEFHDELIFYQHRRPDISIQQMANLDQVLSGQCLAQGLETFLWNKVSTHLLRIVSSPSFLEYK